MKVLGFLGGGNLASAFVKCFVTNGYDPQNIIVSDIDTEKLRRLEETYKVKTTKDNRSVVLRSDVIFIAVKPAVVFDVLKEVEEYSVNKVFVSFCAGVSASKLKQFLPHATVVRTMPNILVKLGEGFIAVCKEGIPLNVLKEVKEILQVCGEVVEVEEKHFDVITALAGSGPAFLFLVAQALCDGAVRCGLSRELSIKAVGKVFSGVAKLLNEEHPEVLKDSVMSPGGTTAEGIMALEESRVRYAFMKAIELAKKRSEEISKIFE